MVIYFGVSAPLWYTVSQKTACSGGFAIYLAEPNLRTEVFSLTSKNSVNLWGGFLALGFLIVTYGPGDIVLFSVTTSWVDTIYTSRIASYCC